MANEMGSKNLDTEANESQEDYRLVIKDASTLPRDYRNLIIAPMLNSLRYGNDLFKLIDQDAYYKNYSSYISSLLEREEMKVKLAILNDDTVLGWSLYKGKVVHYVWVKSEVRRQGIGRALLPKDFDTISHITNKGINIWVSKYPGVRFDPFA